MPHPTEPDSHNCYYHGIGGEGTEYSTSDVSDRMHAIADGFAIGSRLSWADTFRNVRLAVELGRKEPLMVVEVGCGQDHPLGRLIAGMGIDTHYVGMDVDRAHALNVLKERGRRPFVGAWQDANKGIPLRGGLADVVLCLEAFEHFAETQDQVLAFLTEVKRVLAPWGIFYLATPNPGSSYAPVQHPHCHNIEWPAAELLRMINMSHLKVVRCYNYRARPQVAKKLRMRKRIASDWSLPDAINDAYWLPTMTDNAIDVTNLVPGNVLYYIVHPT